jgi:hypothetical protein
MCKERYVYACFRCLLLRYSVFHTCPLNFRIPALPPSIPYSSYLASSQGFMFSTFLVVINLSFSNFRSGILRPKVSSFRPFCPCQNSAAPAELVLIFTTTVSLARSSPLIFLYPRLVSIIHVVSAMFFLYLASARVSEKCQNHDKTIRESSQHKRALTEYLTPLLSLCGPWNCVVAVRGGCLGFYWVRAVYGYVRLG